MQGGDSFRQPRPEGLGLWLMAQYQLLWLSTFCKRGWVRARASGTPGVFFVVAVTYIVVYFPERFKEHSTEVQTRQVHFKPTPRLLQTLKYC